jgi:hypothetical protein
MATLENLNIPSITSFLPANLLEFILIKRANRRERKEVKAKVKAQATKPPLNLNKISSDQAEELLKQLKGLLNG